MTVHLASGGGAWVQCTNIYVNVAGTWQEVAGIAVNVNGEWKTAYGTITDPVDSLQATIDRTLCLGSRTGAGEQYTQWATVTPGANAVGTVTYLWEYVSGDSFTILEPAAASTSWYTTLEAGQTKEGVYRVTVTDSDSPAKTTSFDVTVRMWSTGGGITVTVTRDSGQFYPEYGVIQYIWTASVSGGNGSYSYSWSGTNGISPAKSGTIGANQAYYNSGGFGAQISTTVTCTVTDTAGNTGSGQHTGNVYN